VTYVLRWTGCAPRPRHDVTWQSLNMDLFTAVTVTGGEAGLGGADVLAHSGPIEEQPAT
jgi:hypothetical protein